MEIAENFHITKDERDLIHLVLNDDNICFDYVTGSLNDLKRLMDYVQNFSENSEPYFTYGYLDICLHLDLNLKMTLGYKNRYTMIFLNSSKDEFYEKLKDAFESFGGVYNEISCGQYQETFVVDCYEHLSEHLQKEGITYRMLSKKSGYSIRKIKKCFSEGKYLRDFAALCYHAGLKLKVSIE